MITLSHAEKRALTPQNVISRITGLFSCSSIVVATEKHQVGGFHFHATDAGVVEAWAGLGCLLWNEASIGSFLLPNRCGDRQCGSRAPTRPEPSIGHIVDDI